MVVVSLEKVPRFSINILRELSVILCYASMPKMRAEVTEER